MINPLRSEAEAFRFLIASIVYFGAIVIARGRIGALGRARRLRRAHRGGSCVVAARAAGRASARGRRRAPHAEGERRILVIANETVGGARCAR